MSEIIHVKCGLEGCNSYYDYNLQENEIAALEAEWKIGENIEPENINLWGQMPRIGQVHEVTIRGAIKIDLSQNFWIFYQDPVVFEEGFETEEGIESVAFCLCEKVEVVQIATKEMILKVKILEIMDLEQISNLSEGVSKVADLKEVVASNYADIKKIDNYILLETNYQGDVGDIFLFKKNKNKVTLLIENYWNFHESIWRVVNDEFDYQTLNKKQS